jgi:Leucine Rich repeat
MLAGLHTFSLPGYTAMLAKAKGGSVRLRMKHLLLAVAALSLILAALVWFNKSDSAADLAAVSAVKAIGGNVLRSMRGTGINFNNNTNVTDDDLKHLKAISNIIDVGLGNTRITDAGLAHLVGLKKLKSLDLRDTAITDAGLAQLKKIPGLRHLNLRGTEVTPNGLIDFQRALPKCQLDIASPIP